MPDSVTSLWSYTVTPTWPGGVTSWVPASQAEHYRDLYQRTQDSFDRLWRAFLILCVQVLTLLAAAVVLAVTR